METAAKRRQDANDLFRAGKHAEARDAYASAIAALAPLEASGTGGEAASAARVERATLLSNRAACQIRLGKFDAAIEDATDALEVDGSLVKARYRRAQAFHGKGQGMRAVMDLQEVLSVDPGNAGAKALLSKLMDEGKRGAAKQPAAVEAAEGLVAALKGSSTPGAAAGPGGAGPSAASGADAAAAAEPKLRTLGPGDMARKAAGDSKPAGVAPDAQLDMLVGHMARGLQGRGAMAAAAALAGRDGPMHMAEALAAADRLAPLPLLSALRQVGVHAGPAGVASLTRAVARHPDAFWPAAARGGSTGPFADKEVPEEAGRLMALAEVAAGAQEPRLAALALCSEEDLGRATGGRAVQLVSRICGALQTGSAAADVRGAVGTALAAIAHTLGRSTGVRTPADAAVTGVGSGPGGPSRVERLSAEEAAVHCAGRVVRTRAAADVALALGLPRRLAAVAADSTPRLRRAAEGALARVVERAMQPPDTLPTALEAVAGGVSSAAAAAAAVASASAVVAALSEWRRKRRLHREPTRMASVIKPIVSDVVDADAESRRAEAEAEAEADSKASSRRAMRQLAARRRNETRRQKKAAAAAAAGGAGDGDATDSDEEEEEEEETEAPTREEAEAEAASLARERARKAEEEEAAAKARSCPVTARHRAAVGLATAFLVDRDAALQAVRWRGLLPAVVSLATAPSGPAQAACAEVLSHMAADADGREALGEGGWTALRILSEEGSPAVQATALVTLSRAMASAKATAAASLAGKGGEESAQDRAAAEAMGLTKRAGTAEQPGAATAAAAAASSAAASAAASGAGGEASAAEGLAAVIGAKSLTTEERGMLESFAAASRSLVLGVGPGAEVWAARARAGPGEVPMSLGGSVRGLGSSPDATGTVTLAADEAGMFAITVRSPPDEEGPKGLGRSSISGARGGAAASAGSSAGHLPAGSVIASSARSVEALAVLCTRTVCKRALAADKPTMTALLAVAGALAAEASAAYKSGSGIVSAEWGPAALGVCYCIYALCVSEQERRERALAERDVTPRQWQEFQKLTMGGGGEDPEADPSADVDKRMEALLDAGALGALHRLADAASLSWRAARAALTGGAASSGDGPAMGGGDGTWVVSSSSSSGQRGGVDGSGAWRGRSEAERLAAEEQEKRRPGAASGTLQFVSSALQCLSGRIWARRRLAGGGGVRLLLRLADESSGNTMSGRTVAAHALAQILVSTNPALLTAAQRADVVGPLLLLTHSPSGLQCFEAALALTNVSSHGAEEAQRVVAMGGLAALEDVQFCDHPRLRRAGTEALSNLAVTPSGAGLITGERLGLWLALARGYGDDVATSVAAAGGLAMAMAMDDGDPVGPDDPSKGGRARVLGHPKGITSLCCAVASGHQPLQHRALAALQMLADVVVPATGDRPAGSKDLAGWEELTRPREIGNEDAAGEDEDALEPTSEAGDALPPAVRRQAADVVTAAASAGAPSASGVKVSAVHLSLLLSQGQAMMDLTAAEDEDDSEAGGGGAAAAPELQPVVRDSAIALLADVRRAATKAGVELAF